MNDEIARALEDLEAARVACLAALQDRFSMPQDRVRAAGELRHLQRERLALLERQRDAEAEARARAELGHWS